MLWVPCPQESAQSLQQILIRLTSFALAFLLLAISIGWPLSQQLADVCWIAGLNGIAFYFALELVADQRARQEQQALLATNTGIDLGEQRLSYRLYEEQRLAKIREAELPKKARSQAIHLPQ